MKRMNMREQFTVAAIAAVTIIGFASQAPAAVLLQNGGYGLNQTEVRYNFDSGSIYTDLTTDASGHSRTITTIWGTGGFLTSGIAPGSTGALFTPGQSFGDPHNAYNMSNTTGMPTDNFQVSIYVSSYTSDKSPMTIFALGDGGAGTSSLRLGISGNGGGNLGSFYAEIDNVILASFAVPGNYNAEGLMIQRMNGEWSFWRDASVNGTWTQVGGTSSAVLTPNWANAAFFVKPGGSLKYDGVADQFQVQSFAPIPEPSVALLLAVGGLLVYRRSRKV